MVLAAMTWQEVRDVSREAVVVVPTGSLEQHGPHLPLMTDTLLVTAVAEEAERRLADKVILAPTTWLGCSSHHLAFEGSLSNSFESYMDGLENIVRCLSDHGFWKFYLLNGHGGNTSPNDLVCRRLKEQNAENVYGHVGYFDFLGPETLGSTLTGASKTIRHACEAESSLMMHLHPRLVRTDKLRDDGLADPSKVPGLVWMFDEITEEGSLGEATLATADKGRRLFEEAVAGVVAALESLHEGVALAGPGQAP
ncbi:MAG: creatininase family protein [Fimbriimonadaceae bacterium]|nr:creatininase family protein [Fimbriimonadaceae bacterium]QYK58399.1 MAG: creatininase family protein [Fimbriimonadaceae bacterium]